MDNNFHSYCKSGSVLPVANSASLFYFMTTCMTVNMPCIQANITAGENNGKTTDHPPLTLTLTMLLSLR